MGEVTKHNHLWQSRRVLRIPVGVSRGEFEHRTRLRAQAVLDERRLVDSTARRVADMLGVINVAAVVPYVRRANGDEELAIQLYRRGGTLQQEEAADAAEQHQDHHHHRHDDDENNDNDYDDKLPVRKMSQRSVARVDALENQLFEL